MKNLLSLTLLIVFLLFTYTSSQAQLWKKINKSVERTVEDRVEKEASEATDEVLDDMFEGDPESDNDPDTEESTKKSSDKKSKKKSPAFGMGSSDDVPDRYNFAYEVDFDVTTHKDKNQLTYLLDDEGNYFGFVVPDDKEKDEQRMVFDTERDLIAMFMRDKKGRQSGMVLPSFVSSKMFKEQVQESNANLDIQKTGRTKKILDYNCEEYTFASDQGHGEVWITQDIKSSLYKVFGASMAKNKKAKNMVEILKAMEGFVLESNYIDVKKQKNNSHMIATRVILSPKPIVKSDYTWDH